MSRHTLIVTITVDVDDPLAVRAAALEEDWTPGIEDAVGAVVVDVIAARAVPALHVRGLEVVMMGHASAADQP